MPLGEAFLLLWFSHSRLCAYFGYIANISLFDRLLFLWEGLLLRAIPNELDSYVSILAPIGRFDILKFSIPLLLRFSLFSSSE